MLYHKQGAVYRLNVAVSDAADVPQDISAWEISSQLRDKSTLVHTFRCEIVDGPAGHYIIEEAEENASVDWPAKVLYQDIVYTVNGENFPTETFPVTVQKRVTHAD